MFLLKRLADAFWPELEKVDPYVPHSLQKKSLEWYFRPCQVPKSSRPSLMGTVIDGPMMADLACPMENYYLPLDGLATNRACHQAPRRCVGMSEKLAPCDLRCPEGLRALQGGSFRSSRVPHWCASGKNERGRFVFVVFLKRIGV